MAMDETTSSADRAAALQGIIQSAQRLGVELDEAEAAGWVAALEVETTGGDVVVDVSSGIFGHRVSMLDFTPADLERFREIGEVVGFPDRPPELLTALALSGSAAQGKVQSFPGDCDYFERIHITAPTRADACAILAREMRDKALATRVGPTYRLWEVKFGSYPFDGRAGRAGRPQGRADLLDGRRGRRRRRSWCVAGRAGDPDLGRGRRTRAGASSTGSWPTRRAAPWPTRPTCST